jgi:hypothetical protein
VKYAPLCIFFFRNINFFSCFSGLHYDFEISFNLNGYFFHLAAYDSVNLKISDVLKQKPLLKIFFFQNSLHFHTD